MPDASDQAHYSRVAMWIHWTIATLIIANLTLGILHDKFGESAEDAIMFFHKSIGVSVLVLSIGRLAWRLGHRPPPFDPVLPRWEVALARAVHWAFYVLMIVVPLTGWLHVSAAKGSISFFGLFPVPALPVSQSHESHELWEDVHFVLALAMLGLLVLHIAGAVKQIMDGHGWMIGRMAPWLYRGGRPRVETP
jgi:cytochrome b561